MAIPHTRWRRLAAAVLVPLAFALGAGCSNGAGPGSGSSGELEPIGSEEAFEKRVLGAEGTMVVEFATRNCGWCAKLEPVLAELAPEYEGRAEFAKVYVDRLRGLGARYDLEGVPVVIVFREGEEVGRIPGFHAKPELRGRLDRILEG
ncbi:MAG: thioredoxin family protein [Candidatus Brocadiia bacterium]